MIPSRFLSPAGLAALILGCPPAAVVPLRAQEAASPPAAAEAAAATDQSLSYHADYRGAIDALGDGLHQVAATKLERLLGIRNLPAEVAADVRLLLVEALVRGGRPDEALDRLGELSPDGKPGPRELFWRAHALAATGRLNAAQEAFAQVSDQADAAPRMVAEAVLGRSAVLVQLGDPETALSLLQTVLSDPRPAPGEAAEGGGVPVDPSLVFRARLRAAEIHLRLGRPSLAIRMLDAAVAPAPPPADDEPGTGIRTENAHLPVYLRAKALLALDDPGAALAVIEAAFPSPATAPTLPADTEAADPDTDDPDAPIALPPPVPPHLALARLAALAGTGRTEEARVAARRFIADNPSSPLLESAFALLEQLGEFRTPEGAALLTAWTDTGGATTVSDDRRRTIALYHQGKALHAESKTDEAVAHRLAFIQAYPNHPLRPVATLELAEWLLALDRSDEAVRLLGELEAAHPSPEVRAYIAFAKARVAFNEGDPGSAADAFRELADPAADPAEGDTGSAPPRPPDQLELAALFNEAVASLQADRLAEFEASTTRLDALGTPSAEGAHAQLLLERGLFAASRGEPRAEEHLEAFLRAHPDHPDAVRAHLSLAELALLASFPPKTRSARERLERAASTASDASSAMRQRIDYLRLWIAEAEGDLDEVIAMARSFLSKWTNSPLRDDVRMKLGEVHYRREDYPNAQLQFETLEREDPASPFAEAALFFAGKAALMAMTPESLDTAVGLWEEVAARKGGLELYAREQQALAKRRLGRDAEALRILESILSATPPPPDDLRYSALIAKGEALFALSREDPARADAAIEVFDLIARTSGVPPAWRHQGLFRKGKALESLERPDEALETFYDVVNFRGEDAPPRVSEHLWYYRAGFEAIRLLEARNNWRAAIKVADRLADAGGPRAPEARDHAERLRLQHFIWEEDE